MKASWRWIIYRDSPRQDNSATADCHLAECFNVFSQSGVPDDSDAIAELPASFPAEFEFSAVALPAPNHDVRRLFRQLGPAGSPPVVNGWTSRSSKMAASAGFTSS